MLYLRSQIIQTRTSNNKMKPAALLHWTKLHIKAPEKHFEPISSATRFLFSSLMCMCSCANQQQLVVHV